MGRGGWTMTSIVTFSSGPAWHSPSTTIAGSAATRTRPSRAGGARMACRCPPCRLRGQRGGERHRSTPRDERYGTREAIESLAVWGGRRKAQVDAAPETGSRPSWSQAVAGGRRRSWARRLHEYCALHPPADEAPPPLPLPPPPSEIRRGVGGWGRGSERLSRE